ncbi:hypothetical protein LXL04_034471 [Taraxacum kok-saghyz]
MKKSNQICSPSPKNKIRERKLWWRRRIGRKRRIKSRRTLKSLPQNRDCSSLNPFFGSPFSFSFQSITSLLSTFSSQQLLFLEATIDMPLIGSSPIPTLHCEKTNLQYEQIYTKELVDANTADDMPTSMIGQRIVLPASFIRGPRDMRRRFLDAMALVQDGGKPDIFLTMTCNPKWLEIQNELLPWQKAED